MIYLAKETLLWAYKTLSTLSNDPNLQGATQKISAVRYALALDMFYKQHKRECNTRDSNDKAEFVKNINRIVAINDDFYTTNFYVPIASHQRDCAVGSNFYSVGAVKNSLINPSLVINYPQRGNTPLFEIQNGKLFWRSEMITNLNSYISSEEHKLALALWLVRKCQLDSSYVLTEIDKIYHSIFTDELCNILIPKYGTDENLRMINFNNQLALIDPNDIERLFNIVHKTNKNNPSLPLQQIDTSSTYLPYLAALRTKPFMLLAGISGTGKSRIARQIAKACWAADSKERTEQVPSNFRMIQVKPNWHDSTELLGYVSRIDGEKYVVGKFLPFVAKAWENPDIPHILCLDEMNLAPIEQYFAEYLSVIESRKLNEDGTITTDPIISAVAEQWFWDLVQTLTSDGALQDQFKKDGIILPPNLFVIGTVNMDETTFSFSRKVLDRAMTIEMNEVDLEGGLTKQEQNELGEIGNSIIGHAVEGKDIYEDHQDYCDQVIAFLKQVNDELENTPFKIAYRTRNEFLLYAVNRKAFDGESSLETALDEMTSMKILPRIEGDSERVKAPLEALRKLMQERNWDEETSTSLKKIKEMLTKLQQSGYNSYWT